MSQQVCLHGKIMPIHSTSGRKNANVFVPLLYMPRLHYHRLYYLYGNFVNYK